MTLANLLRRFCIVLLLLSFQSSLNESKDTNNNADLSELEKFSSSSENPKAQIFSQLKKLKDPRSMAAKLSKRLNEQRMFERERFCQSFNNNRTACAEVPIDCLRCSFNYTCVYGSVVESTCRPAFERLNCTSPFDFPRTHLCAFCYQLPESNYTCSKSTSCKPHSPYLTNCTVDKKVLCMGNRRFSKFVKCQPRSSVKWNYALIFSITLGGFGMDRFYLGNWQEAFGKLFSFGGLGFWTLIDVILIWVGYLKPADGNYS